MKSVATDLRHVELTGVAETAQMTIHADARMFKNLLDSIYSEKEKTVVRELMANAFDAHVEASCQDREIEVHLPTLMEPTLVVRDFGIGMSHEFMMKLYSALGFSSKADSNSQTGMFGVGSKSPLSITDTFTVKAFDLDGTMRTYIITIPSDDHPQISYAFSSKQQGEHERGIEVTVPLDHKKRQAVLDGLASQHFCWFDKPVKFLGALEEIKHKFYTSIAQLTPGLYIATPSNAVEDRYNNDKWNVHVRQGAAVYPLNQGQMRGKLTPTQNDIITNLCTSSRHVLIDLPLGTANVTMAREAIQYDGTSSDNIAKVVTERFVGFATLLETTIGDARDFQVAQKRIVEKFYPTAEHGSILAHRLASSLLNLCEKKVVSNWKVWYDLQPDVAELEYDSLGKPTGKLTGKMVRPKLRPPQRHVTMQLADFPEGKVLLHKGTLTGGRYDAGPSIGGAESNVSFKSPNLVFVLPSHLREWKDRIKDYCTQTYKSDVLPQDRSHGIPIQVVRCAKRNIDEVKAALIEHGVLTTPITMDELPNIEEADIKKRNFSKTSVYPWAGGTWEETKIEPDYAAPAYYIARVGIAHDVHLTHPTKPVIKTPTGLDRQQRTTNYNIQHLIADGRKLGFLDATIPLYRVTENQAERIATNNTVWIHLPTLLWETIEKKLKANVKIAVGKSRLGQGRDGLINDSVNKIVAINTSKTFTHSSEFFNLIRYAVADPLFEVILAVRRAVMKSPADFKEDSTFDRLYRALYQFGSAIDQENVNKYDKLQEAFEKRFKYLSMFWNDREHDVWLPHARMYLDGAFKIWDKEKLAVKVDDYPEFKDFVKELRKELTEVQVKINKASAFTNPTLSTLPEEEEEEYAEPNRRASGQLR